MPRAKRIDKPGMIHHVRVRALENEILFRGDLDRGILIRLLEIAVRRYKLDLLAFALMVNHIHLLLRRGRFPLWRAMHFLNSRYANGFNARHKRRGYLFENRYRSKQVGDLTYQGVSTVYIHRNQIVSGLPPAELASNPWNGHGALVGAREIPMMNVARALEPWADQPNPRAAYQEQMEMACAEYGPFPEDFAPGGEGPAVFVELPPPLIDLDPGFAVSATLDLISERAGVSLRALQRGSRETGMASARAAAAFVLEESLGLSRSDIATIAGVSGGAITRAIERGPSELINLGLSLDGILTAVRHRAKL